MLGLRGWWTVLVPTMVSVAGCMANASPDASPQWPAADDKSVSTGFDAGTFRGTGGGWRDSASSDPEPEEVTPTIDVISYDAPSYDASSSATAVDSGADSAAASCATLAELYAREVRSAQTCSVQTECSSTVCETLCCSCRVFVNASLLGGTTLSALQLQWHEQGCGVFCTALSCGAPVRAECSLAGRCTTLRAYNGGG